MGSIKVEAWDSQLFQPSNLNYPVKVFISVMEHKAITECFQSETDMITYAVSQLDTSEIKTAKIRQLSQMSSWDDFKSALIYSYNKKLTVIQKAEMYQALTKDVNEYPPPFQNG